MSAIASFADRGYAGTSVRDIVGPLGCSVAAISLYFGSKAALAEAVVEEFRKRLVLPVAHSAGEIRSDYAWRVAVKSFVSAVIGLFTAKDAPDCYFAALYRHESANLHAKKVTLHQVIMQPLFHQLEGLMALGVDERDPVVLRLRALALWNNVIAYALKHSDVLAADVPEGVDPLLFRDMTIDFMVEKGLDGLHFS